MYVCVCVCVWGGGGGGVWILHEKSAHARSPIVQVPCPSGHTVTGLLELCTEESEKALH